MSGSYPEPAVRRLITVSIITATLMVTLDSTIANVALPHIQGSVAASADEITWVLTSYIVASAIMIPLTGWLADRYGRKRLLLTSITGFTIVSGLCGASTNLPELVLFRLLQGICGAALMPMSQAILLDINPPADHGKAMAVWGMGAIVGPIVGPALGGWLTDNFSWRWVFLINVPVGALSYFGLLASLDDKKADVPRPLDLFGYGTFALALGALQMMLDRGQSQDWFSSPEICIEGGASLLFAYLFLVHTFTAPRPFVNPVLFKDRNFALGTLYGFGVGMLIYAVMAMLPPMLETLLGYPVVLTGLVMAPRGVGSFVGMWVGGQLIGRVDPRILILVSFGFVCASLLTMTHFTIVMGAQQVVWSGLLQGLGTSGIFAPLAMLSFATLDPSLRNEGAVIFTLARNTGSAIGISVLGALTARNAATVHARLVEGIRPDNPLLAQRAPDFDFNVPAAVARMNAEITRQAAMVAYIDAFWLLLVLCLALIPTIVLLRPARGKAEDLEVALHVE